MKTEILSTKSLAKGNISQIEVHQYYDLHGQEIGEGVKTINFDKLVSFEIIEETQKWIWSNGTDYSIFHPWKVIINGEQSLQEYEVTGYKLVKDRLLIRGCTGAG